MVGGAIGCKLIVERLQQPFGIALDDATQVEEGVLHLSCDVDAPCPGLVSLAEIGFQSFADDGIAHMEDEVGVWRLGIGAQEMLEMAD